MASDGHRPQIDGRILAQIPNGIVRLYAQNYGKGPVHARTHHMGDALLCVLHDGLIAAERALVAADNGAPVHAMRRAWQDAMREDFQEIVETATGRRVLAFLSQVSLKPDVHIELFLLEPVAVVAAP